jgi:hypothetical protein
MPHFTCKLRYAIQALFSVAILIAVPSVRSQTFTLSNKMLRDTSVNHDMAHIHLLLGRERQADDSKNEAAEKRAITAIDQLPDMNIPNRR